jgi:hypothetical protein
MVPPSPTAAGYCRFSFPSQFAHVAERHRRAGGCLAKMRSVLKIPRWNIMRKESNRNRRNQHDYQHMIAEF